MFPELIKKYLLYTLKICSILTTGKKKIIQLDCFEIVHDIRKPMFFPDCCFYTQ